MKQYLDLLEDILENGKDRGDRTGTGTRAVFGRQMRFDLGKGFPAVTTKRLAFRTMLAELIWFLQGSQDVRELRKLGCYIWDGNVEADYWKPHAAFEGDAGRIYGVQWRNWRGEGGKEVDQLKKIVTWIKRNPTTRRMLITAWNPAELDASYDPDDPKVALCPCHVLFQFFIEDSKLSLQMYQRSADVFLGVPFNIASYSMLLHMIAAITKLGVGDFVHVLGDTHIYSNHINQAKEQLGRKPYDLPKIQLDPAFYRMNGTEDLDAYLGNFKKRVDSIWKENDEKEAKKKVAKELDKVASLISYKHHPSIKADMAV